MPLFPDLFLWDSHLGIWFSLILSVSENGFGKRTDVDRCRLKPCDAKGVINMKATPKVWKVTGIKIDDEVGELMVSQFGKIIRIDTNPSSPAEAPRVSSSSTTEPEDKVHWLFHGNSLSLPGRLLIPFNGAGNSAEGPL